MLKYELNTDRYGSHEQIIQILGKLPPGSRILDVGAAGGYLAQRLAGRGYALDGIERDPESARLASPFYDEFYILDLDGPTIALPHEYDAIVLADVLEHLRSPLALLVALRRYLATGGRFIVSVPNVANITVRLKLLLGRFDYAERGILDETHLRFYTWKTIRGLLHRAQLSILEARVTPSPLPLVYPSTQAGRALHGLHRLNWMATNLFRRLLAYQFILVAMPSSTATEHAEPLASTR